MVLRLVGRRGRECSTASRGRWSGSSSGRSPARAPRVTRGTGSSARYPAAGRRVGLRRDRARAHAASSSSPASARRSSRCATRSRRSPSASSRPIAQVGYFRAAQAPITGLEALSAPVRLILLTEQTRDVEEGRIAETYPLAAALRARRLGRRARARSGRLGADAVARAGRARRPSTSPQPTPRGSCCSPPACGSCSAGRSRSRSRSAGRGCGSSPTASRSSTLLPLVLLLGDRWGATGAAVGVLVATVAFAVRLGRAALRLRREHRAATLTPNGAARAVKVLVVSGIWPPDVGGPASHAPDVARFLQARGPRGRGGRDRGGGAGPRALPRALDAPVAARRRSGTRTRSLLVWRRARRGRRRLLDRHVRPQRASPPRSRGGPFVRQAHRRPGVRAAACPRRRRGRRRRVPGAAAAASRPERSGSSATGCCAAPRTSSRRAATCASS